MSRSKTKTRKPRQGTSAPPADAPESEVPAAAAASAPTEDAERAAHAPDGKLDDADDAAEAVGAEAKAAAVADDEASQSQGADDEASEGQGADASTAEGTDTPEADGASTQPTANEPTADEPEEVDPAVVRQGLKRAIESLIFVTERPVTAVQLGRVVKLRMAQVKELVAELAVEYEGRGIELAELGGGYAFRSSPASAPYVRDFVAQRPVRLTRAQLETLALVAYRQPITRPEIDDVRGVDTGSACRVLLERGLIKIIGRKDEPGRPLLYGTAPAFLEFFGLRSLKDLPTLREFADLTDESRELFKAKTGETVEDAQAELDAEATTADEEIDPAALAAELGAEDDDDDEDERGDTDDDELRHDPAASTADDDDEDDEGTDGAGGSSGEAADGGADERLTAGHAGHGDPLG